jgi:phospholipid-binding lipoprotein MlaA
MTRKAMIAGICAISFALSGCATAGGAGPAARVDPLEPFNRAMFGFNEFVDRNALEPAARAYEAAVPELFQFMIGNFFSNVGDVWTAANQLLQGKPREAASDASRVLINSTLGFLGVADVATEMGLEKHREDFGQTLGRWGVASGPYLVLPIFGSSSVRDGFGLVADVLADPLREIDSEGRRNNLRATRIIDTRASFLRAGDLVGGAALDKYSFVRDGYLQRRRSLVWDGEPPLEDYGDED